MTAAGLIEAAIIASAEEAAAEGTAVVEIPEDNDITWLGDIELEVKSLSIGVRGGDYLLVIDRGGYGGSVREWRGYRVVTSISETKARNLMAEWLKVEPTWDEVTPLTWPGDVWILGTRDFRHSDLKDDDRRDKGEFRQ
jgi:hypothetical protein